MTNSLFLFRLILLLLIAGGCTFAAEETPISLDQPGAAEEWIFTDTGARIQEGELILDGRAEMTKAFYRPLVWNGAALKAEFMAEPAPEGVLACGFVLCAQDAETYYFVHFDRGQAILGRSDQKDSWTELKRARNLDKPAGKWHDGEVRLADNTLTVLLNGKELYSFKDTTPGTGRIGFYANQGRIHVRNIRVEGTALPADRNFPVPPPPFVHVCTDGGNGGYEAFPDVCRLDDGRLMCVFYDGYKHVSLPSGSCPKGGRISCCYSSDEGRTWSKPEVIYDGPDDDRDPSIAQLPSGRLICNFFSLRKKADKEPPWTGLGSWLVMSDDMGATWSDPIQVSPEYYCSSPVRVIEGGRLILGLYGEKDGMGWGAVSLSEDDGKTWSDVIDIDNNGMRLDAETDIITLKDGRLFAAQRGRDETMGWSVSEDGGKTWSVSEAFGFRGHCPYLHRSRDGILLLAHRLPDTSLHYSLDEGKTWQGPVRVDNHHGAYPSMVTLKDGTILIVYYEEGAGSDIRARRFLATRKGIRFMPVNEGPVPEAELADYRRIWDQAPHNAFTNLIRAENRFFCVFREGEGHVSPDGALRVITSEDGVTWESAARITSPDADLRDAQITRTPDGRFMLSGAAALHQPADVRHQTMAYFSEDGFTWSSGMPIGDPNLWLWRITWHKGAAYGIGYYTGRDGQHFIRLYRSDDGHNFETLVDRLRDNEYSNESSMVFLEDDTCLCLLRRDDDKAKTGLLGRAKPPYTDWTWQDLGVRIGGPVMTQLPDGRLVAAVRLYDDPVRTALCWIDPDAGTLREFLRLPSGGDTSYPGLVWHKDYLHVSYYASHEEKTCIYYAKVKF
jgi:hypothetical protein